MDKDSVVLKSLEKYFDKHGWPQYVDSRKYWDRASLSNDKYKSGWKIVEIERHRAICGDQYRKGLGMEAFQTYWMRYAVNIKNEEVEELPEREGDVKIDNLSNLIDEQLYNGELVSFEIQTNERGKYLIIESVSNIEEEVSNLIEAKSAGREAVSGWVEYFEMGLESVGMQDKKQKLLVNQYKKHLNKEIDGLITKLWEKRC